VACTQGPAAERRRQDRPHREHDTHSTAHVPLRSRTYRSAALEAKAALRMTGSLTRRVTREGPARLRAVPHIVMDPPRHRLIAMPPYRALLLWRSISARARLTDGPLALISARPRDNDAFSLSMRTGAMPTRYIAAARASPGIPAPTIRARGSSRIAHTAARGSKPSSPSTAIIRGWPQTGERHARIGGRRGHRRLREKRHT
jgi:hypothetical protein